MKKFYRRIPPDYFKKVSAEGEFRAIFLGRRRSGKGAGQTHLICFKRYLKYRISTQLVPQGGRWHG